MIEEIESNVEENIQPEDEAPEEQEEVTTSIEVEIDEIEVLKSEIEDLYQKSEEYLDGWRYRQSQIISNNACNDIKI